MEDTLAWHFDNKGMFSVKSMYHVLEDKSERDHKKQIGGSSKQMDGELALEIEYSAQGHADEEGGHCFLKCKGVKQCWRAMGLEQVREEVLKASNATDMICMILDLPSEVRERTVGLLWAWWEARNKANVGEQMRRTEEIVHRAVRIMAYSPSKNGKKAVAAPDQHRGWVKPPPDKLKINCDWAFIKESKNGAWGFVIRDQEGNAVDLLCLVSALKTGSSDYSLGGVLFCEITDLLRSQFLSFEICHVPRSCNMCAHELANYGLSRDSDQSVVWTDPLPEFVNIWVHSDLNDRTNGTWLDI
ncbi:hypothetical protein BS78_06G027900 [Paspalum vaginatum]|nr:hypothetical protein BS78_06G027900 [Paspalum vaginatum]